MQLPRFPRTICRLTLPMVLCLALFFGQACQKEEGFGGTCTLKGRLYIEDYNELGVLKDTFYGPDERVFIVYGEDDFYGDELRTHYDGSFRFDHLYPGTYTVFAYTECDTCFMPDMPVKQTVTFTKEKETIITPDIVVRR